MLPTHMVTDIWGDRWRVEEARSTQHGFDVFLGRPAEGNTRGARRVIVTAELSAHLEAHRHHPSTLALPISLNTIGRLRALLGHNRYIDRAAWWEDRAICAAVFPRPGAPFCHRPRLICVAVTFILTGYSHPVTPPAPPRHP